MSVHRFLNTLQKNPYHIFTFISFLSVVFLYFNLIYCEERLLSILFVSIYFFLNTLWLSHILRRILNLNQIFSHLFGFFLLLYLISFGLAIPIVLYKITPFLMILPLLVLTLGIIFLRRPWRRSRSLRLYSNQTPLMGRVKNLFNDFSIPKHLLIFFPFLIFLGFYLLARSRTGEYILTPWEVIPKTYLYLYAIVTLIVILFIFSKHRLATVLLIIIIHSFLLHAYLPLVYETGFGGDKWRHLGAERSLGEGKIYSPALFGQKISWQKIGFLKVPAVFMVGNKTSYANMWGLTLFFSKVLGIDVFWIDLLLLYIIWSLFFPLILFQLGKFIFQERFPSLLLAFLPSLFYPFEVYGSISLPSGMGFLFFVFVFLFWLYYLIHGTKYSLLSALILTLIGYWGYILNFILATVVGLVAVLFRPYVGRLGLEGRWGQLPPPTQPRFPKQLILLFLVPFFFLFLPLLEFLRGLSYFRGEVLSPSYILTSLSNAFGRLSGLVSLFPSPTHLTQGNFIYMQIGKSIPEVIFLSFPFLAFFVSSAIWFLISWGIYFEGKKITPLRKVVIFLTLLLIIFALNYFISWHLMEGLHTLVRRLDLTLAFLMMVLMVMGTTHLLDFKQGKKKVETDLNLCNHYDRYNYANRSATGRLIGIILPLFLVVASTSTYASGPRLEVVTRDEVKAAQYIWDNLKIEKSPHCVLANTWPLLALEAVSSRQIVAGNFPLYRDYAQPERVYLFKEMSQKPSFYFLNTALSLTKARTCYYMTEDRFFNEKVLGETIALLGQPVKIGEIYIWHYQPGESKLP